MAKLISDEKIRLSIVINGNSAQKELLDLEKSTRSLTKSNNELKTAREKLKAAGKQETEGYKVLNAEIKKNNETLSINKVRMSALQKEIGVTGLTMSQLEKKAKLLRMQLKHTIPGSAANIRYTKDLQEISARLGKLQSKAKGARLSLSSLANGFNKYAALGASVIATMTGVVLGLQSMIDYNGKLSDAQSDVQKTTGMTKVEVDELTKSFGMLATRTSRIDLLKVAEEGGRIGILKKDIQDFVTVMNKATVALGDSFVGGVSEVAAKLGKLKLLFKETKNLRVDKAYESIGSAINELGANGVATEANIANFATRVGALPDALKPTISDALSLGAAFEESGVLAEISGRAYSIFLGAAATGADDFAKVMGISTTEVEHLINTDPTEFFLTFAEGLKGMNGTETAKTLAELKLNADGVKKIIGAAGNNVERFRELMDLSNVSMREASSLTNEYNIKNNNLAASLEKLQKKIYGAFSSQAVVKGLTSMIQLVTGLISPTKKLSENIEGQRINLFLLESIIKDVNTSSEARLTIIRNLKKEYPTLLSTIDAEKVSNEELTVALRKVNDQLINKIILQKKDEGIDEHNKIVAEKKTAFINQEIKVRSLLGEQMEKYGIVLKDNVSLMEQSADLLKQAGPQQGGRLVNSTVEFNHQLLLLRKTQEKLNHVNDIGNVLLEKRNELKVRLGVVDSVKPDVPPSPDPLYKEGDTKLIGGVECVFKNRSWVLVEPKVVTPSEDLSPEDQAIISSKLKLKEFLEAFEADEALRKELLKFNEDQREKEEELMRIERKFEQMAEEAGFETTLAAGLEEAKQFELDEIRSKWDEKELDDKAAKDLKYAKLDKKSMAAQLKADQELEAAKENLLYSGVDLLGAVFGQKTAIYKLMFGIEKAMAINEVIVGAAKALGIISASTSAANAQALLLGPFLAPAAIITNTAVGAKQALTTKITAGVQLAQIAAATIQGFEGGMYDVVRAQDGKDFSAVYGGETKTGMVYEPTVFSTPRGDFLAGEKGPNEPELIIDGAAYKEISPEVKQSLHREISRVKGFETGYYASVVGSKISENISETSSSDVSYNASLLIALNRNTAVLEKLDKDGVIAYLSNDLKTGKQMKKTIDSYVSLISRNKL